MKTSKALILLVLMAAACPALADWQVGDPYKMHFPQLPDLQRGLNVYAGSPMVLADDFLCTQTGPITDIHLWGSWLNDQLPTNPDGTGPDPGNLTFLLSLHTDVPASPNLPYSHPGDLLWQQKFAPGQFKVTPWAISAERFLYPGEGVVGSDNRIFEYNFEIPDSQAFTQKEDQIYWLDVSVVVDNPDLLFGWKTSDRHFNDNSVYATRIPGQTPQWRELFDPATGVSLDQAFVITPEPATLTVLGVGVIGVIFKRRRA